MLLRALVVLLVILNLGVALWWAVRDAPPQVVTAVSEPSTLQLVGEPVTRASRSPAADGGDGVKPDDVAAPAGRDADADVAVANALQPADPPQCVAVGPFTDTALRDATMQQIAPRVARIAARDIGDAPRGWRVWMAPLADRAAATAMVARLLDAGFNDYYIIGEGAEANGIALGRFGSETSARAQAQALRTAGFEADAAPLGEVQLRHWIDAMLAQGDSGASLPASVQAQGIEPRDCDAQWDAG